MKVYGHYCSWKYHGLLHLEASNGFAYTQGFHIYWETWKNESTPGKPGKIMEFCKKIIKIMEYLHETWKIILLKVKMVNNCDYY